MQEGFLIDNAAARSVHNKNAVLHLREAIRVELMPVLISEWGMDGNYIRSLQQAFKTDSFHAAFVHIHRIAERIVSEHLHAQRHRVAADDLANIAKAYHTQRFAKEFDSVEILLKPLSGFQACIRAWEFANERKHHSHRQFRHRERSCHSRVHDGNLMRFGCVQINVVNADAHPPDYFQVLCRLNHFRSHFCASADDDGVIIGDNLKQFSCFNALFVIRSVIPGENCFSVAFQPISNQYFPCHSSLLLVVGLICIVIVPVLTPEYLLFGG